MKKLDLAKAIFLLASPFLIGWGIFSLLSPSTFWQNLVTLILVLVICIPEGFVAWCMGLIMLDN